MGRGGGLDPRPLLRHGNPGVIGADDRTPPPRTRRSAGRDSSFLTTRRRLELLGGAVDKLLIGDQDGCLGGPSGRLALTPDPGLKPDSPEDRTHDLLRPLQEVDRWNDPEFPASRRFLRVESTVGWPCVRFRSGAKQTHHPAADMKKTCKCRPSRERLKGFEPSTFCMASRTCGSDSVRKVAGNSRVSSFGVSTCGRGVGFPGFPRETTGVWAPNGHPDARGFVAPTARSTWQVSRNSQHGRRPASGGM